MEQLWIAWDFVKWMWLSRVDVFGTNPHTFRSKTLLSIECIKLATQQFTNPELIYGKLSDFFPRILQFGFDVIYSAITSNVGQRFASHQVAFLSPRFLCSTLYDLSKWVAVEVSADQSLRYVCQPWVSSWSSVAFVLTRSFRLLMSN